jgi:hypothetical protein
MGMPPQLRRGLEAARRRPRRERRPIVEELRAINVNDLAGAWPSNWHDHRHFDDIGLRYPFLRHLRVSRRAIDFTHPSGQVQSVGVKWIKTGAGVPRAAFICSCGRPVITLYAEHGRLACRRCVGARYLSQTLSARLRPVLQAARLRRFLDPRSDLNGPFPAKPRSAMRYTTYRRLRWRGLALEARVCRAKPIKSQRLRDRVLLPRSNYSTDVRPVRR